MNSTALVPFLLLLVALAGIHVAAFLAMPSICRNHATERGAFSTPVLPRRHDLQRTSSSSSSAALAPLRPDATAHASLRRQRRSVTAIQTSGLFGLGAAEIAIIAIAAAFLLGPQKLAEFGRDAGKVAGELKEVPREFQKEFAAGLDEGETEARSRKAKPMASIPLAEIESGSSKPDDSTAP